MAIKSNLDKKLKANTQQRHQTRREQKERKRERQSKYNICILAPHFVL